MTYYDDIASGYDELHGLEQEQKLTELHLLLRSLGFDVRPEWKLLDVGCGTGISTAFFNCTTRVGIDPSVKLLEIALRKYPDITFINARAEELKKPDVPFDIVISLTALQNCNDLERALKNILFQGKRFALSVLKVSVTVDFIRNYLVQRGFTEYSLRNDIIFIKF